jgi:hypothetical protein
MSKYAKTTFDGWIVEDFKVATDALDRALQDTGAFGVQEMRAITSKHDATGGLTESMMFITDKGVSSFVKDSKDKLEAPSTKYSAIIGTGKSYGIYRETYSGIHRTWDGHEEFVESMKEWCKIVLGIDPDRSPGEAFDFAMILKHVRETRTEGDPFVLPNKEKILKYLSSQWVLSMKKFTNSKAHKEG